MGMSTRLDVSTVPFARAGFGKVLEAETLAQDAGRTLVLAKYTLMAQVPGTELWTPWINEAAIDGTEFPLGILKASVTAAQLVAGNVVNIPIIVGDTVFDEDQLVFDAVKTMATVIATLNITVRRWLSTLGLWPEATVDVDGYENA